MIANGLFARKVSGQTYVWEWARSNLADVTLGVTLVLQIADWGEAINGLFAALIMMSQSGRTLVLSVEHSAEYE